MVSWAGLLSWAVLEANEGKHWEPCAPCTFLYPLYLYLGSGARSVASTGVILALGLWAVRHKDPCC